MIYAIFGAYLLAVAVLAVSAVTFILGTVKAKETAREIAANNATVNALNTRLDLMKERVDALAVKADSPTEGYGKILREVEDLGHLCRTAGQQATEATESCKRLANKYAARESREKKPAEVEPGPEFIPSPSPAPAVNGRPFGRFK